MPRRFLRTSPPRVFSVPARVAPLVLGAVSVAGSSAFAADNLSAIKLEAERSVLRADGRSTTIISAQVFDERGNVVPDGTRVSFTTTAGRLDATTATTRGGVARVSLTSSDQPGDALVVAVLENAGQAVPARLTITFSRDADNADTGISWIGIGGSSYVGYAADHGIIQCNGSPKSQQPGARITYRGLAISADTIQINVRDTSIVALGRVTITGNGDVHTYSSLRYVLLQGQGVAERLNEGRPRPFTVTGRGTRWEEVPFEEGRLPPARGAFALEDLGESHVTVVARSIQLEPNRRLQFRRATFYYDGQKTLSFPFHVMDLGQTQLFAEQVVGFGPQGVQVDFPLYYDVRPQGVGTLHLRRGARVNDSAYGIRSGWTFDAVQDYSAAQGASGTVELNGLSRSDWGARVRHAQQLGKNTSGSAFVDFPNHNNLFASTQVARTFKTFNLNLSNSMARSPGAIDTTSGQRSAATSDFRTLLLGETYDRQTFGLKSLRYVMSASLGQQYYWGPRTIQTVTTTNGTTTNTTAAAPGVTDPTTTTTTTTTTTAQAPSLTTQFAGTRLFTTPITIARGTTASQSFSFGQTWLQGAGSGGGAAKSGLSIQGTTAFNRNIRNLGSVGLTYDYTQTPLLSGVSAASTSGRHRVGATTFLGQGDNWNLSLNASHALDADQSTLYSSAQFKIGGPWRGRLSLSASRIAGITYNEAEYALVRRIAGRDIAVYYSTTSKRFQLDFTGARF